MPRSAALAALVSLGLAACATSPHPISLDGPGRQARGDAAPYKVGKPYQVKGVWYTPAEQPHYNEVGIGSWYGEQFHNHHTANGEIFDMDRPSAAHKTLPLPCLVEVTNLDNGRKAVIRINDRGPFVDGRIIDLSRAAAQQLGYERQGVAKVRVRYIGPAPVTPGDPRLYKASAPQPKLPSVKAAGRQTASTSEVSWPRFRLFHAPALKAVPVPTPAPVAAPVMLAASIPTPPLPSLPHPSLSRPSVSVRPDVQPVQTASLPPPQQPAVPEAPAPDVQAPAAPVIAPPEAFQVQAGAYASRASAQRVASSLSSSAEPAEVVETQRDGATLYKVVVRGGPDEAAAHAVRERVVDLGYKDARVVVASR